MNIPHIKNAYENIKTTCEKKITELYPNGIPDMAQDRLTKELSYLKNSIYIDDFELARLLFEQAKKSSQYISCRGNIAGSFIYYLISSPSLNPLPPHYICPNCGDYKTIDTKLIGFDLPEDKCPICGSTYNSDGYNMSIESVWGTDGKKTISFEYNTSEHFYPFAKRLLERVYPKNEIVNYGIMSRYEEGSQIHMNLGGYVILSDECHVDDYPEMQGYLEDGELCITGNIMEIKENNMKRIILFNSKALNTIIAMQQATGIYVTDISYKDLKNITWNNLLNTKILSPSENRFISVTKPDTMTKLINYLSALHSTFISSSYNLENQADETIQMLQSEEFIKCPIYSRDDVFDKLTSLGYDTEIAFAYSEYVRKGLASRSNSEDKYNHLSLPEEITNITKTVRYLFPRAHSSVYALTYYILAYYLKTDSKAYSKILKQINP